MPTREIWGPLGKMSVPNVHPSDGLCAGKGSMLAAQAIDTVSCFKRAAGERELGINKGDSALVSD